MALFDLYWDTISRELCYGPKGPTGFVLPNLRQEDGVNLSLTILKRVSQTKPPFFQVVNIAGYSLQISIGTAGSVIASQNSFTSEDAEGRFAGVLGLNTSGVNALTDGAEVYFEIRLFDGSYYFGRRFPVKIEKAIATAASLTAPAGDTALGSLEARRTYVRKELGPGEGVIWTSQDQSKRVLQYLDNDGEMQFAPIT